MTTNDDEGYVHDPSEFDPIDDEDGFDEVNDDTAQTEDSWFEEPVHPEAADREFGARGWILVGVIVYAFIVSPLLILFWPMDLGYRFALLILPLLPAVVLAATAVWATTRR